MSPFFSIVIPTYNRADLVSESIHSVLRQTYPGFEIVVVDDGSTDDTEKLVRAIASDKLVYFKTDNEERGAARNFGIRKSKGQYITFLDSDDRMKPDHLAVLFSHLSHRSEDFIATRYGFFDEDNFKIPTDVKLLATGYHTYATFLKGNPLACCFTMKRENPDLIFFREERSMSIMEDWIFLLENLQKKRLFLLDACTLEMRDHAARSMRVENGRVIAARKRATEYLLGTLKLNGREMKLVEGYSAYFCAIHYYLDGDVDQGIHQLYHSSRLLGPSGRRFFLLIKLIFHFVWRK